MAVYCYVRQGRYVIPGVCLSVFVSVLRKNYWTDLHENFTTDVSAYKEELIKFGKSYAFGTCSRKFLKDSSTLASVSGESDRIFMQILSQMYHWTRKFPLNLGINPDPDTGSQVRIRIWTPDPDHILLDGRMRFWQLLLFSIMHARGRSIIYKRHI